MTLKEYLINKGLDYDRLRDLYREQRQFRNSVKSYNEFSKEVYDNETAPSFFNLRTLKQIDKLGMNINNAVENQIQVFKQENDLIEHNVNGTFYFNLDQAQKQIYTFRNVTSFFPAIEKFATINTYEFVKYVGDNFSLADIQYLNNTAEYFIRIFNEYDLTEPIEDIEHLSRLPRIYQAVEDMNTALSMFVIDYEDTV